MSKEKFMVLTILDVVALMKDMPDEGLRRGQVGTIVDQWKDGVFEVEFSDEFGQTYAFATLHADQMLKLNFPKDPESHLRGARETNPNG